MGYNILSNNRREAMSKFKVGDKVRLKLFITYGDLTKDTKLTVKEVFPESGMMFVEENDYLHSIECFRKYPQREKP